MSSELRRAAEIFSKENTTFSARNGEMKIVFRAQSTISMENKLHFAATLRYIPFPANKIYGALRFRPGVVVPALSLGGGFF